MCNSLVFFYYKDLKSVISPPVTSRMLESFRSPPPPPHSPQCAHLPISMATTSCSVFTCSLPGCFHGNIITTPSIGFCGGRWWLGGEGGVWNVNLSSRWWGYCFRHIWGRVRASRYSPDGLLWKSKGTNEQEHESLGRAVFLVLWCHSQTPILTQ